MAFIDIDGFYYEGEKANINDIAVPTRPSLYHRYDQNLKEWVLDDKKVLELKRRILFQLDEDLKAKTLLLNLNDIEKQKIQNKYDEQIKLLSDTDDPIILQEITL